MQYFLSFCDVIFSINLNYEINKNGCFSNKYLGLRSKIKDCLVSYMLGKVTIINHITSVLDT